MRNPVKSAAKSKKKQRTEHVNGSVGFLPFLYLPSRIESTSTRIWMLRTDQSLHSLVRELLDALSEEKRRQRIVVSGFLSPFGLYPSCVDVSTAVTKF